MDVSVVKVETTSTNGMGDAKSEGSRFVFGGRDAAKLEAMESAYQGELRSTVDTKFAAYASETLGKDFSSLSAEEQLNFKMDNTGVMALMTSLTVAEMGPSPQQQVIARNQELLQQGIVVPETERRDLPVINPGN